MIPIYEMVLALVLSMVFSPYLVMLVAAHRQHEADRREHAGGQRHGDHVVAGGPARFCIILR